MQNIKNNIYYILPALNESQNIEKLFKNLNAFYKSKNLNIFVIYVNDGSTDDTIEKLNKIKSDLSKNISLKIINHEKNLGLGQALKSGFIHCFSEAKDQDILITMDTDNSHTIDQSYELFHKILVENADIAIASRYVKDSKIRGLKNIRILLSYLAAKIFKTFFHINNVRDYTCGFRAYRVKKIKKIILNYNNFFSETGFSASADILLKLYKFKDKLVFKEIPIDLRYDLKEGKSKMKILKTIYLNIRLILIRKIK